MSRRARCALVLAALGASFPGMAIAQTAVQPGSRIRGTLAAGDAALSSGEFTDVYTVAGHAGQRLIIRLSSTAFDPYLLMRGPSDFSRDNDDEASGSTAARLDVRLPVDGTYRIIATSYRSGETGEYELEVQEAGAGEVAAAPAPGAAGAASRGGTLTVGQTARGTLATGDETMRTGELYDTWRFQGRRGQRLTARLASGDFDPYLLVRGPGNFSADNDDDASERGSRNSRLDLVLPADGEYRLIATSYRGGESGGYTISLLADGGGGVAAAAAPAAPRSAGAIGAGQTLGGRLEPGDAQLRTGEFVDFYTLQGSRGQRLEIRLVSSEFDPYVQISGPAGFSAYNDDDVDGGTSNSHLVITLPADGAYQIAATSFRAGEAGGYRLSVAATSTVTAGAGAGASAATLSLGRALEGALEAGDDTLPSGERVDRYTFQGRTGQRVALDMSSRAFDAFVQMVAPSGRIEENDDAGQNTTDARLETVLAESGAYTVLATSLSRGMSGAYRLAITSLDSGRAVAAAPAPGAAGAPPAAAPGAALTAQTPQNGRLQAGDATLPSGEFVDRYAFDGRRGQVVTVDMTSTELDPYLIIVAPSGAQQENDDASASDRNARVTWVLPADGRYTVMATTYRPGEAGSYAVRYATGAAPIAAAAARPAPGAARRQQVYAVLVGISDYAGQANNLAYTAEDAQKLAQTLNRAGVLADGSVVLTDADATYDRVRSAFQQVAQRAGPDDVFLFFYSGHGTQLRENAANTSEPDLRDEAIVLRDRIVTDDEMGQWFRTVRSRMAIIALDACFSGGFARDVVTRPGIMGFFSSEEDLTSAVAGKFQAGGYLSHFLRTGLAGEADENRDGNVTAGELSSYVRRQFSTQAANVEAETMERQHNYQFPVIERGGVKIDDVVLALGR